MHPQASPRTMGLRSYRRARQRRAASGNQPPAALRLALPFDENKSRRSRESHGLPEAVEASWHQANITPDAWLPRQRASQAHEWTSGAPRMTDQRTSTVNASVPTPGPWVVGTQFAERHGGRTYIP